MKRNLIKIMTFGLAILLIASLLSACFGRNIGRYIPDNDPDNSSNSGSNNESPDKSEGGGAKEDFKYGNGKDYILKNLKGDFSITYEVTGSSSDDVYEIIYARTSEGYYINFPGMDMGPMLYIKNGDKYDLYLKNGDVFEKIDVMDPVDEEQVQGPMLGGFMTSYGGLSGFERKGSETIAGRDCDKFELSAAGMGAAVRQIYCIDKETGVCMKFSLDAAAEGQVGNVNFECIEFKTSGVTLTAHK